MTGRNQGGDALGCTREIGSWENLVLLSYHVSQAMVRVPGLPRPRDCPCMSGWFKP